MIDTRTVATAYEKIVDVGNTLTRGLSEGAAERQPLCAALASLARRRLPRLLLGTPRGASDVPGADQD